MKKNLLLSCLLLSAFLTTLAQKVDLKQLKSIKPRCIGPSGMSGRITSIDAVIDNPNIIYLGAASGGVWKTENAGTEWKPVFDEAAIQNIGSIAIQQNNPSVVWVGTGEGNPRNSLNIGGGIYKSLDAGKTWQMKGLEKTRNIHRIIIDPVNPNIVYAGAIGNPYAVHPERGVFKTTDGGETWNRILYTNDTSGVGDMVMDPSNPNKLFAAMWQHQRTPYSFKSGGNGSGLYMTIDAGKNWKKLGKEEGLPDGNYGRIGITISKSSPNRIYALIEATKNGLYKSDDGGYKWELVNTDPRWVTNRPFYFQDIRVDPLNENRLWLINQIISVSEDGGRTFNVVVPYSGIHPDHHAFWIHPNDPSFIIDGNDGGIGITRDRGKTWQFDEKLPVGQFYHISVDNETPYNVMGGMQDNGSWRGPAYAWTYSGIRNFYWESLWGGDGFDVLPDPDDANWIYAMSQEGEVGRYNVKTGQRWGIQPFTSDKNIKYRFNWNSGMAQDPFDNSTIYFGSQFVHKSTNKGASWQTISPDLTTNDSLQIDQSNNGGISLDITGAENHCTILCIEPSKKEKDILWVGTDDGNVQLTRDGGKTWTNFRGKIPGMPTGCWIPQIRSSRFNAAEAFVVCNDYRRGDFKPYIFRTTDFGKTWTRMVDEKKVVGYALCMIQDPTEPNLVFVGTEQGLWISFDNGDNFQQWKNNYPSVSTYDLAIQEREADLVIATFGRAVWIMDDIRPLRKIASQKGNITKRFTVFNSPEAIQSSYKNAPGYEWSTWGTWNAENRSRNAEVSYFYSAASDTGSKKPKTDTAIVKIYADNGEIIRNLKWKVDTGLNRRYWGMEEKGLRAINTAKPVKNSPEPGGFQVLPGTYKVVLSFDKESDSTYITVKDDPRLGNSNDVKLAQRTLYKRLRVSIDKLIDGMDRLTEAEEATNAIDAYVKSMEGKEVDSLRSSGKSIRDDIKKIREFINGKRQDKQGYQPDNPDCVVKDINEANGKIFAKPIAPGAAETAMVETAERSVKEALQKINAFFDSKWKQYRQQAENTPLKIFREYAPLQ